MNVKTMMIISGALLGCFTDNAACAHHLWVVKTDDYYMVARGVLAERMDPYNPNCVKEFVAVGLDGIALPSMEIQRIDDAQRVRFRVAQDISLVGVSTDWGYRVNTTRGKKLLRRQEAERAGFRVVDAFFSTQCAKVFLKESPWNTKPIGMKLELVPLEDPQTMSVGSELSMQAFFNGKPLAGIIVLAKEGKEISTDENGAGRIKIKKEGPHLLMMKHKVPVKGDPEKDFHLFTTFLLFEVRK